MEDKTNETPNEINPIDNKVNETDKIEANKKKPKKKKSFIFKYVIFVIILVLLTAGACYYTIKVRNKTEAVEVPEEIIEEETTTAKQKAEDSIYAINSYQETYNENSIKVEKLFYLDGETYSDYPGENAATIIQISGLKDKNIENEINNKLKKAVENWEDKSNSPSSYVIGNFSNVLSVEISSFNYERKESPVKTFNIDLNTGDEIPFEKVFVSSAPVKSMLIEGLYNSLSWNNKRKDYNEETWELDYNMDNVDTSDYEDKSLLVARKYDKIKDNIQFTISPRGITIYNLLDKDFVDNEFYYYSNIGIAFYKYKEEIAIYKRYLSKESLFEDDSIGMKNVIVFTNPYDRESFKSIYYGKLNEHIFLEEAKASFRDSQEYDVVNRFIDQKSKELRDELKRKASSDNCIFCQREYDYNAYYDNEYNMFTDEFFEIDCRTSVTTCSKEHFKEDIFLDYIKIKARPMVEVGIAGFEEWNQEEYPNYTIKCENYTYYLDKEGNIVATSYSEMGEFLKKKMEEEYGKVEQIYGVQEDNTTVNEDESLIGEYTNTYESDTHYYSALLKITNETDTTIKFELSAASGIDIDHVNIGQVSGTAKQIESNVYKFENEIEGKTNVITFTLTEDNNKKTFTISESYPDNFNPYGGHNVSFAGDYTRF